MTNNDLWLSLFKRPVVDAAEEILSPHESDYGPSSAEKFQASPPKHLSRDVPMDTNRTNVPVLLSFLRGKLESGYMRSLLEPDRVAKDVK